MPFAVALVRVLQLVCLRFLSTEFEELEIVVLRIEVAILRRQPWNWRPGRSP